jgi:hypothetical protein
MRVDDIELRLAHVVQGHHHLQPAQRQPPRHLCADAVAQPKIHCVPERGRTSPTLSILCFTTL